MMIVPLVDAGDESAFGGKAASLATALRVGLPAPPGFALSHRGVDAILRESPETLAELVSVFSQMKTPIAVRSSAIGEDSAHASFAGQHLTVLNVTSFSQLRDAIAKVAASVRADSAASYREKIGIDTPARMGIVLQELIDPEAAGVMFTQNPITGADERVIEAAWGLGEVVVAGLVIPDYFRLSPDGTLLEKTIGDKDVVLRILPEGGTEEIEVAPEKVHSCILSEADLEKLLTLAVQCETVYGKSLDIEWCLAEGKLYLLQCRAITVSGS